MHNISFWEEPDWRRESTLNPNFVMVVVAALFLVVGLGAVSFAYTSRHSVESELSGLQSQNSEIESLAENLRKQQQRRNEWRRVLDKLETKRDKRLLISRQLEALHRAVPPEIVLEGLEIRAESVEVPGAEGKKEKEALRYVMSLSGVASGPRAQAAITGFANRLRPGADSVIGARLLSSELKNISGGRNLGETNKNFTIVCTYKPVQ